MGKMVEPRAQTDFGKGYDAAVKWMPGELERGGHIERVRYSE